MTCKSLQKLQIIKWVQPHLLKCVLKIVYLLMTTFQQYSEEQTKEIGNSEAIFYSLISLQKGKDSCNFQKLQLSLPFSNEMRNEKYSKSFLQHSYAETALKVCGHTMGLIHQRQHHPLVVAIVPLILRNSALKILLIMGPLMRPVYSRHIHQHECQQHGGIILMVVRQCR